MFPEATDITVWHRFFVCSFVWGCLLFFWGEEALNYPFDDISLMKGTVGSVLGPLDHI